MASGRGRAWEAELKWPEHWAPGFTVKKLLISVSQGEAQILVIKLQNRGGGRRAGELAVTPGPLSCGKQH